MRWLLAVFLLSLSTLASAADVRFDAFYFFQSESVLQQKGINVDSLGRYTRALQSQIYKAFKKTKVAPSTGYVVIAIRSDGATYSWLDMTPTVHEYFDNQIYDIVQKLPPPDVKSGIFVFAMKMAIDTPVFTRKPVPEPADWPAARKRISNPDNIEELVMSLWPD